MSSNMYQQPVDCRWPIAFALFLFSCLTCPAPTHAGIEPENVLLVVNQQSQNSQRLADEYANLRSIPDRCILKLSEIPDTEQIGVDVFREKILIPVLKAIEERGLRRQIQLVVYSSDFPTIISIKKDLEKLPEPPGRLYKPAGSLTGLTYLYESVLAGNPAYIGLNSNWYARSPAGWESRPVFEDDRQKNYSAAIEQIGKGNFAEARFALEELLEPSRAYAPINLGLARCAAAMSESEVALRHLRTAIQSGFRDRSWLENCKELTALHDLEGWQELVGLLPESMADDQATLPFGSQDSWMISGFREAQPSTGRRYMLSAMLGVTRARGTSIDEAIDILQRAAEADGTRPKGTFVFQKTANVRTTTRSPGFASAQRGLEALGYKTKIISQLRDAQELSIAGLMTGTSKAPLRDVDIQLLPGAIAENFTSFGGVMKANAKQTPLSDFLLEGAAASSGTVTEPFALQEKFPHPFIHVHYARGVTLIEAFYLSVASPSQLLIVGDPLCAPWKRQVAVEMSLGERDETEPTLTVNVKAVPGEAPAATIDVFIDGKFRVRIPVREEITIRVEELDPGPHEITLIATSAHLLRSTKRQTFRFTLRK